MPHPGYPFISRAISARKSGNQMSSASRKAMYLFRVAYPVVTG